MYSQTQLYFTF